MKRHFRSGPGPIPTIPNDKIYKNKEDFDIRQIANKKVCLILHFGLGDMINMIPVINHISAVCQEVKLVCLEKNIETIKTFFTADNISYLLHTKHNTISQQRQSLLYDKILEQHRDIYPFHEENYSNELSGYTIIRTGYHKYTYEKTHGIPLSDSYTHTILPFEFYRQIGLPYALFWNHFSIPTNINNDLMNHLQNNKISSYIFIHNTTGDSSIPLTDTSWFLKHYQLDSEKILFINPNTNMYSTRSSFYKLANLFINKPILDYRAVICQASFVFLTNSSFFCLSLHLDIKTENKYIFERQQHATTDYFWNPTYGYQHQTKQFYPIISLSHPPPIKTNSLIYVTCENVTINEKESLPSSDCITYISGGKLGDFILQLGVIHANYTRTGKKGILYIANIGDKFARGVKTAYDDTKEFIMKQEYIYDYQIYHDESYDVNLSSWRENVFSGDKNWYELFYKTFNIPFGISSWVTCIPVDDTLHDIVLIAHSLQRENNTIDMKKLLRSYAPSKLRFICLDENEYISFTSKYDISIPPIRCSNIMELLISINSCKLFIGNLSAPFTCAIALHKPCIGITPTSQVHEIDIRLLNNINRYWPHVTYVSHN